MGEAVEELNLAAHRLQRFVEGETARTIYKLPPGGRFDPMRRDVAALLSAITRAEAQKEGSTASQGAARVEELEKALETPSDKPQVVDYPPRANAELLRVIAVVPPKGFEAWPIPVCAEQNNKVLGTWNITAKGDVVPAPWNGSMVSERPTSSACKAFILSARDAINQKVAEAAAGGKNPAK